MGSKAGCSRTSCQRSPAISRQSAASTHGLWPERNLYGHKASQDSLIVRPHSKDANGFLGGKNFVDQAVLNIDTPGICTCQIPHQLFKRRRVLKRVCGKHGQKCLCLGLEATGSQLCGVIHRLAGIHNFPVHHSSDFALLASGSAIPVLMDSRMPGTASRYKVS